MTQYTSRAQLKEKARDQMAGHYGNAILLSICRSQLSIICVVISTSFFEHQTCIFTSLFFALSEEFSVVPTCVLSCDLFDTPHPVSNETPMAATSVAAINLFIHIHPFSLISIYNLVQFYHTFTQKNRSNLIFLTNLDLFF